MRTYDIKAEYNTLYKMMENPLTINEETGEILEDNTELLKQMMSDLDESRDDKLDNIEYIKREMKLSIDGLKAEAKRISERAKMYENNVTRLSDLQDFLLAGQKVKTEKFTYFYGKSESLAISDEKYVPSDYIKLEPKIDKSGLKKAIKDGLEVDGISLVEKISMRVR